MIAHSRGEARPNDHRPSVRRPAYPSIEEQIRYYKAVGMDVTDGRLVIRTWCPFGQPPPHLIAINLANATWACLGRCGSGDIYLFEAHRTRIEHLRHSINRVWEMIAANTQPAHSSDPDEPAMPEPEPGPELTSIERAEARRVAGLIRSHPGRSRRRLQQEAHVPAIRSNRVMYWLEQEKLVAFTDEPSTAGRPRRIYFPSQRTGPASSTP